MLMTRASEYALLSLLYIAKSDQPLGADALATELGISKSYLAKILQSMARKGILDSFKGVKGGFALAKEPKDISIAQIMYAAEGKEPAVFDCSPSQEDCPSGKAASCQVWPMLNRLQSKIDNFLLSVTLLDILQEKE